MDASEDQGKEMEWKLAHKDVQSCQHPESINTTTDFQKHPLVFIQL